MKAFAVVMLVGLAGCSQMGIKGSGTSRSEVRPVGAFSAIEVGGALDAEIDISAAGTAPRVEVTGDDNLVPLVESVVTGDRLTIRNKENVRPVVPLIAHISLPRLTAFEAGGASTVKLRGVHADQIAITVDGASTVHGDGAVHELTVDASGASTLDLDRLAAERARVLSSGASTVDVAVAQALDVRVSGAGTVNYRGDPPDLKRDVSTAGTLHKR